MSKHAEEIERQIEVNRRFFGVVKAGWTELDAGIALEGIFDYYGHDGVNHALKACGIRDANRIPYAKRGEFISMAALMILAGTLYEENEHD